MREKYIARRERVVLGLRYDATRQRGEVLIGGAVRFADEIAEIGKMFLTLRAASGMRSFSKKDKSGDDTAGRGPRVRKTWGGVSFSVWKKGLEMLRREGYELEVVSSFRRLMQ